MAMIEACLESARTGALGQGRAARLTARTGATIIEV